MKTSIVTLLATLLLPLVLHAQYTYTTNNGALTITKFTGGGAVTIPSAADGLPVTSIGGGSFNDNFGLTSLVIPDSITNIGNSAFSDCYSMTSVTIGTNVLAIGSYAFQYCSKLGNIQIPASVTNIEAEAFASCTIFTNITVAAQNPAYSSQNGVLFNQDATTLVIYPQDIAGPYVVPDTVTDIAQTAFYQCTKLTSIANDDNLANIGGSAFSGCYNLTNINLPGKLANIEGAAFVFCTNLTSFSIPATVTNIGLAAFAECFSLTNCTVADQNPAYSSVAGVIFDKNQATLVVYPEGLVGSYVVPGTVTSIAASAFGYCPQLWNVTFPPGLTNIGLQAFFQCSTLTNATLPDNLISIGSGAFYSCAKMQGVTLSDSVTTIGNEAFDGCTSLTNAVIGNGVTNIGSEAFSYCFSLRTASIGNNITNIGMYQFVNCGSLTSVTIGAKVASIASYAFENCSSLTNLTFLGNAPSAPGFNALYNLNPAVKVYYQPGTTGWGTSYGGAFDAPVNVPGGILPTVLRGNAPQPISVANPAIVTNDFDFTFTGASNETVIVQVSSDLLTWTLLRTNTLPGTPLIFSDPNWRNYPQRFYRLMGQ